MSKKTVRLQRLALTAIILATPFVIFAAVNASHGDHRAAYGLMNGAYILAALALICQTFANMTTRQHSIFDIHLEQLGITGQQQIDYERSFLCLPASGVTPEQITKLARDHATGRTWAE